MHKCTSTQTMVIAKIYDLHSSYYNNEHLVYISELIHSSQRLNSGSRKAEKLVKGVTQLLTRMALLLDHRQYRIDKQQISQENDLPLKHSSRSPHCLLCTKNTFLIFRESHTYLPVQASQYFL